MHNEKIAIVTDSTCDACPEWLEKLGVFCVNLEVLKADGTPFPSGNAPENIELFYDYLQTCKELPTTSMPSPLVFGELYSRLAREGYTHVLSLHITQAMSGVHTSAILGAETVGITVSIPETARNTWALELLVERACRLRDAGVPFERLVKTIEALIEKTNVIFTLDTLDNLVKGGRAGHALGLAASLLDIKPVLTVGDDGQVVTIAKAKSMKRALAKIADLAEKAVASFGALEGYFINLRNHADVERLRALFEKRGIDFTELGVRQVGPVIATHVGLGCVGFAYIPKMGVDNAEPL